MGAGGTGGAGLDIGGTGGAPAEGRGETEAGGDATIRDDDDPEVDRRQAADGNGGDGVESAVGTTAERALVSKCGTDPFTRTNSGETKATAHANGPSTTDAISVAATI